MNPFTLVKIFSHRFEAELAKSTLEGMGITSRIKSDDGGGTMPHLSLANGVQLLVEESNLKKALEILNK